LVFIFLEQMRREKPLIPQVSHLFFGDVLLFTFPGPIAGTDPFSLSRCHSEPAMFTSNEKFNRHCVDRSLVSL
jgi:hypothetical protein